MSSPECFRFLAAKTSLEMASDGEDEDLARAIALSLGKMEDFITADRPAVSDNVIDLSTESEDDDDLDKPAGGHRPPRESVQQSQVTHSQAEIVHEQRDIPGLSCTTGTQGLGILQTMNRRQMEAERLERTMKRKRPLSPPSSRAPQSTCDAARPVKRQATELDLESSKMPPSSVISDRQPHEPPLPGLQYPKGVVKKTWAYGYPRQDDIKIEEVLQKSDLELAVLSSFQWDEQWIMSKLNLAKTKVVCVVQAKSEAEVNKFIKTTMSYIDLLAERSHAQQRSCQHQILLSFHGRQHQLYAFEANVAVSSPKYSYRRAECQSCSLRLG